MEHYEFDPEQLGLIKKLCAQHMLDNHDATVAFGRTIASRVRPGDFIGLVGTLGVGKTTFMQGFVSAFDDTLDVRSPTYGLSHIYDCDPRVIHMDLYRLESVDELESIGYWDYLDESDDIICVEWLDKISEAWPGRGIVIELQRIEKVRKAKLWACDPGVFKRFDAISFK